MRNTLTILFILACAQVSFGQLSGSLSGTLGPGTYHVVGTISVNSGDSLRLMPGTTFIFDGPYPFWIYGTLLAEGTESDSIVFTTEQSGDNRWRGLCFEDAGSSGSQLTYCLIEKGYARNWPHSYGGGVACRISSSPTIENCTISGNEASDGGGVYCWNCSPTFANCTISGNSVSAYGYGGGVLCESSSPTFTNCTVSGNSADWGGGIYCIEYSSPTFTNCTVSGNSAIHGCGGVLCEYSSPTFNSTIIAFSTGSGIYFDNSGGSQIGFCDLYGNVGGNIQFWNNDPSHGPPGIGQITGTNANGDSADTYLNIFINPLFANMAASDFHLKDESLCIGAGNPADTVSTDFEGDPRPNPPDSYPDIGMDENPRGAPLPGLVIYISNGNAVLKWPFFSYTVNIYGTSSPFTAGTLLETVEETTSWTDVNTSSRPSPYFYYVKAVE